MRAVYGPGQFLTPPNQGLEIKWAIENALARQRICVPYEIPRLENERKLQGAYERAPLLGYGDIKAASAVNFMLHKRELQRLGREPGKVPTKEVPDLRWTLEPVPQSAELQARELAELYLSPLMLTLEYYGLNPSDYSLQRSADGATLTWSSTVSDPLRITVASQMAQVLGCSDWTINSLVAPQDRAVFNINLNLLSAVFSLL